MGLTPCGKTAKSHFAILTGKVVKRFRHLDIYADHIRREARVRLATRADTRHRIGNGFGDDLDVRDNSRLAGVDHVAAVLGAAKDLAVDKADAAGSARSRFGNRAAGRTMHHRAVEQQVATTSEERSCSRHLADFRIIHLEADGSNMPGVTIWLWSTPRPE